MTDRYNIFRGVQKPIEFRGFKGHFIYMGIGGGFGVIVIGGLIFALFGAVPGCVSIATCLPGWFFYLSRKQKRGLSSKTNDFGIIIFENKPILTVYEKERL